MSTVRFLSICVLLVTLGGILTLGDSDLMEEAMERRLESLRKDLFHARKRANDLKEVVQKKRLTDALEGLNEETNEESMQKKSNTQDTANDVDNKSNKDAGKNGDDKDDDNEVVVSGVSDGIFYIAANLADKIKATCHIDIAAIFKRFSPVTLAAVNEAETQLGAATKALSDLLASSPGFADDLQAFVDSSTFKASDVVSNIDKTFKRIDKTLSTVEDPIFCAEAQLIAIRLQLALYGGVGFANGYMCNKVFVELGRYQLNATKLLKASTDEDDFVKNCTKNLIEDITCYEKELEAFNKIVPTTPFTKASPLQMVAFTSDFLIDYGVILMYHRDILRLEAEIIKLCAVSSDEEEKDVDKKDMEEIDEDTESLTEQLQKLLRKLNEVSAKKKEAQEALDDRTGHHNNDQTHDNGATGFNDPPDSQIKDTGSVMPSAGEKTAIRKSYYREREN